MLVLVRAVLVLEIQRAVLVLVLGLETENGGPHVRQHISADQE